MTTVWLSETWFGISGVRKLDKTDRRSLHHDGSFSALREQLLQLGHGKSGRQIAHKQPHRVDRPTLGFGFRRRFDVTRFFTDKVDEIFVAKFWKFFLCLDAAGLRVKFKVSEFYVVCDFPLALPRRSNERNWGADRANVVFGRRPLIRVLKGINLRNPLFWETMPWSILYFQHYLIIYIRDASFYVTFRLGGFSIEILCIIHIR